MNIQMLVTLLKNCAAMTIIVEISFSMLLSAEMTLPRYLKLFASSSTFLLTLVFLVLGVFSFMSLILVECILRQTVSVVLPTLSVFLGCPFRNAKGDKCLRRSVCLLTVQFLPVSVLPVDH